MMPPDEPSACGLGGGPSGARVGVGVRAKTFLVGCRKVRPTNPQRATNPQGVGLRGLSTALMWFSANALPPGVRSRLVTSIAHSALFPTANL